MKKLELRDDNGTLLQQDVQDRVNNFIENVANIKFFKPDQNLKKADVDKQAKFTLECFGIKAKIEYRKLEKEEDWVAAWYAACDAVWVTAWVTARVAARDAAKHTIRDTAWVAVEDAAWGAVEDAAWDTVKDTVKDTARAAWTTARATQEILLVENTTFTKKYPNGAYRQLFKLWEMGVYPVGISKETGTFIIYADPIASDLFEKAEVIKNLSLEKRAEILNLLKK